MFQFLGNPPFFTFSIFVVCIIFFLFRPNILATCLLPAAIFSSQQFLRLFLYPFVHDGFFHIFLNMLAWMTMAKDLEHSIGSLPIAYTVLILLLPSNTIIQTTSSYVLDFIFRTSFKSNCTVGISGVLFSILIINFQLTGQTHASFFGFLSMPVTIYPFVLAGIIQLILPGASLLGHCSGIASGMILARGWFRVVTPSDDRFDAIENKLRLTSLPAWQPVPSIFGRLLENLADHFLPGRSGVTPTPSLRERTVNAWRQVSAWFSSSSTSQQQRQQRQQQDQQNNSMSQSQSATRGGVYMTGSNAGTASQSDAIFSGTGYTLGTESVGQRQGRAAPNTLADEPPTPPQGRVPPNSRLLLLGEQQSAADYGATTAKGDNDTTPTR